MSEVQKHFSQFYFGYFYFVFFPHIYNTILFPHVEIVHGNDQQASAYFSTL